MVAHADRVPFGAEWQIATNRVYIWFSDGKNKKICAPKEFGVDFMSCKFMGKLEEKWPNNGATF